MKGGKKTTRKVMIKRNKGYKSICVYKNGKRCDTRKKKLTKDEITLIKGGIFIPGLFKSDTF
jgi:hypothetical protein